MIARVKLKNWKSHLDSQFEFSPGVNALVGIVGSGKSSILQAISFALFGTLVPVKTRKIGLDDLIMVRPQEKKKAEVELECKVGEDTFTVRRVLERGKGTVEVELRKNGQLVDVAARSVTAELEKALQIDFELFSKAVYSEQNELDFFLRIPKGKRTDHIDRMLKVDRFEAVREQAVALRNKILAQREEKVRVVQELEQAGLEGQVEKALEEVKGIREKIEKGREVLEKEGKARAGFEEQVEALEEKKSELEEVRSALEAVKAGLKETEGALERGKRKVESGKLEERLFGVEKALGELRKGLEEKGKELEQAREAIAGFNARIKVAQDSLGKIEKLEDKCPVCDSDIAPEKRQELVASRKGEAQSLREMVGKVAENLGKIREEKEGLEKQVMEKELERERLVSSRELVEEIKELERKKESYQERRGELEKALEKIEGVFSKESLEKARKELQERVEKESRLIEKVSGMESLIAAKEETLAGLRERERMLKGYREELGADEKVLEGLAGFIQSLGATQEQLRQEFVKTVNSIMEQVWQEIYPYGDFQGIRLVADGDYTLELRGASGWSAVDGIASGGERSLACLALRIAFSHAFIPNLRWLILDEPTHNLDDRAIGQLAEVLRERMGAFAEQVFLVTHDERIAGSVSTLYRLEREKQKNEPSRVVAS